MIHALRAYIARRRFERAFASTLTPAQKAVERARRHHKPVDQAAIRPQREALHRALAGKAVRL